MNIWKILEIEQTNDVRVIKGAYAKLARNIDADEQMKEFLNLRNAYEKALHLAESEVAEDTTEEVNEVEVDMNNGEDDTGENEIEADEVTKEETSLIQVDFTNKADEFYLDCEAMVEFHKLYTEKKCKDQNQWIKYITSSAFLSVYKDKGFIITLVNALNKSMEEGYTNKAFLDLLPLVYNLFNVNVRNPTSYTFSINLDFEGKENVVEFLRKIGGIHKIKSNNHFAIMNSFEDYTALNQLLSSGVWNENTNYCLNQIVERYCATYINEKVAVDISYSKLPRHISVLSILNHFFSTSQLPKVAYEIIWDRLNLEAVTVGRNKLWYGKLREIALQHCPHLGENKNGTLDESTNTPPIDYKVLKPKIREFFISIIPLERVEQMRKLDEFFATEDIRRALRDHDFVKGDVFGHWLGESVFDYRLEHLIKYCKENPDVWMADEVIKRASKSLKKQTINKALEEDLEYSEGTLHDLKYRRCFFRYLFNTAFPSAQSKETTSQPSASFHNINSNTTMMWNILSKEFPISPHWIQGYLGYNLQSNSYATPREHSIELGNNTINIKFHPNHIEYLLNGNDVLAPVVPFDVLKQVDDDLIFWLNLPIAISTFSKLSEVYEEILSRLNRLEFLKYLSVEDMADCLAGAVCTRENLDDIPPILYIKKESYLTLYTAEIYTKNGYVRIRTSGISTNNATLAQESFIDFDEAFKFAREQVALYSADYNFDILEPSLLPKKIIASRKKHEDIIEPPDISSIISVLKDFLSGKYNRLQFEISYSNAIIIYDGKNYACFLYVPSNVGTRYTLLSNSAEYNYSNHIKYEDFLYTKMPTCLIHSTPQSIFNKLNDILNDAYRRQASGMWASECYYLKDKLYWVERMTLAGYPGKRDSQSPYYIKDLPRQIDIVKQNGETQSIPITAHNRSKVQEVLYMHLKGYFKKCTLTWAENCSKDEDAPTQCIELLCENEQYALLYYSESTPIPIALSNNLPQDLSLLIKTAFAGRTLWQNQVHNDLLKVRGNMDILLSVIDTPNSFLFESGDFHPIPTE